MNAPRDENRITALLGTSQADGVTPIPIYADDSTNALLVELSTGDIQIGAVEIKNSTDDTRATVDEYGLAVKATVLEKAPTDGNNPSLIISNDDMVEASTKVITKTINGTDYQKTLSINAGGDVIGVSAWSEI